MIGFQKRVYVGANLNLGLCNRLEALVLACALQHDFGHEIVLSWPELESLEVKGTRRGRPGLLGRWGAVRVRSCSLELYQELGTRRNIILRGFGGPEEKMAPRHGEAVARLRLNPAVAETITALFRQIGPRPVIGVHLRRGDFPLLSEEVYDVNEFLFSAVPVWWHEWMMATIVRRQPNACFLLCFNGPAEAVATLKKNFDIVEVPLANPYRTRRAYYSSRHPVADLFALACCPVVLATPVSSFSHYAANVLGGPSICLMPPTRMRRDAPAVVRVQVKGPLLRHWIDAARQGLGVQPLAPSLDGLPLDLAPRCDWLPTAEGRAF